MGIDQGERKRRQSVDRRGKTTHPYIAMDHRIFDSDAYCYLSFSAKALLPVVMRQLTKHNNGHLHATFKWCKGYGFGSEHTVQKAIAECISHGLLYRTRSSGANKVCARYAITWLPIVNRDGLYLDGYVPDAWRSWTKEKKAHGKTCRKSTAESAV